MKKRRGISLGTVVMLTLTALVLVGFAALWPSFTGHQDIRVDAAQLAVAMDESLSQLADAGERMLARPHATILPPESLATAAPWDAQQPFSPTPQPTATPVPKLRFSLCAAGGVQFNSSVRNALTFDDVYRFDILTDQLGHAMAADLSLLTLEHTLNDSEKSGNVNMPSALLTAFEQAGVNAIGTGHEDALTGGAAGAEATAQAIRQYGMTPFGVHAGDNSGVAWLNLNGCTVGILHYQDNLSSASRKQVTDEERAALLSPIDAERMRADIASLRDYGAQVVMVSLRWGKSGAKEPTDEQRAMAQQLADAGADVIIGTGSGVLQPVQLLAANRGDGKFHPVLCAYSLGNLFSHERDTRHTLASILLKTQVIYDPVTGCVAFEDLRYVPTYAWKGKGEGRTLYRVLVNDPEHVPEFVDKNQKSTMEKSYALVNEVMADTGIEMVME